MDIWYVYSTVCVGELCEERAGFAALEEVSVWVWAAAWGVERECYFSVIV